MDYPGLYSKGHSLRHILLFLLYFMGLFGPNTRIEPRLGGHLADGFLNRRSHVRVMPGSPVETIA
jgi:hypothetical protein